MQDFLSLLNGLVVPVIVVLCACTGYVIKMWIKDVDNKLIPTIVIVEGIVLSVIISTTGGEPLTVQVLGGGAVSGLMSTGCYELIKSWITKFNGFKPSDTTTPK